MNFTKLSAIVFGVFFIILLYSLIYSALKIMYKDVKGGGRKRPSGNKKNHGLEVIEISEEANLKKGSVIPVKSTITIGRKDDNSIVLQDLHVSGYHAKLIVKNDVLFIEDLNSTNGTFVNDNKINGRVKLFTKDIVTVGTTKLKVLG